MKNDFLKECMSDPALVKPGASVPIDDFNKSYCIVCANRECTRSISNNMAFDKRVQNWQNDLFINPPRASDDDPKFVNIRNKNFAPAGHRIEIPGSPNFISVQSKAQVESPPRIETLDNAVIQIPSRFSPQPVNESASENRQAVQAVQDNTNFSQGVILPGKDKEKKENVDQPGSTFTFDDE